MKAGAADFLTKPFSLDHMLTVVNKAFDLRSLRAENRELKHQLGDKYDFDNLVGRSPAMQGISPQSPESHRAEAPYRLEANVVSART